MKGLASITSVYITRLVIRFYQKFISLDHSFWSRFFPYGFCRFHPTCSEYALQAITRYGLIKGSYKAIVRISRCHPWNPGGYDPLT